MGAFLALMRSPMRRQVITMKIDEIDQFHMKCNNTQTIGNNYLENSYTIMASPILWDEIYQFHMKCSQHTNNWQQLSGEFIDNYGITLTLFFNHFPPNDILDIMVSHMVSRMTIFMVVKITAISCGILPHRLLLIWFNFILRLSITSIIKCGIKYLANVEVWELM